MQHIFFNSINTKYNDKYNVSNILKTEQIQYDKVIRFYENDIIVIIVYKTKDKTYITFIPCFTLEEAEQLNPIELLFTIMSE